MTDRRSGVHARTPAALLSLFGGMVGWVHAHPVGALLLGTLLLRLVAAVFSKGYMASDDHHQVVEIAARWLRGEPIYLTGDQVFYRSLLFPALHWAVLAGTGALGLDDPDTAMVLLRIALGVYSLWAVLIAFRYGTFLDHELSGRQTDGPEDGSASRIGVLAGALVMAHAVIAYTSVRSLIEMAAMPPLLHGLYALHQASARNEDVRLRAGLSGLLFGLALLLRVQTGFAAGGALAWLLWKRRWAIIAPWILAFGAVLTVQGLADFLLGGRFLGSALAYLAHNRAHLYGYTTGPWVQTLLLVPAVFIPPFGILFFAAMIRAARRGGVLFWATAAFVVAHAIVPQKQERFLLPIFPELALLGTTGIALWSRTARPVWVRLIRAGWVFFWLVNLTVLPFALIHYGQKARIEPLLAVYRAGDGKAMLVDLTEEAPTLPLYYLDGGDRQRGIPVYRIRREDDLATARQALFAPDGDGGTRTGPDTTTPGDGPSRAETIYVLIFTAGEPEEHLALMREDLGPIRLVDHFPPGLIDRILRSLNPEHNKSKESWLGVLQMTREPGLENPAKSSPRPVRE